MGGNRGRLIDAHQRKEAIKLINEAHFLGARKYKACEALGLSVRTVERWEKDKGLLDNRKLVTRIPRNKLSKEQRDMVIAIADNELYSDLPPSKIVPYTSRLLLYPLLSPVFRNHRPSHFLFSRLNHFNLSAYGLQISLPTLNLIRYRIKPTARYEMRSVALFRQHFQLLVEVHFRGAPEREAKPKFRNSAYHKFIFCIQKSLGSFQFVLMNLKMLDGQGLLPIGHRV